MTDFVSPKQRAAAERLAEVSNPLDGKTPDQVEAYIEANVTDLPTAKAALKLVGRILALHNAEINALQKDL